MAGKTVELESFTITKRETGHFRLRYKVKDVKYTDDFYLTGPEMSHILNNTGFWPYYADIYSLLQVTGMSLHFAELESTEHMFIPFRNTELFPQLTKALDLPVDQELDLFPAYLDSLEKAKPNITEVIIGEANEVRLFKLFADIFAYKTVEETEL